MLLDGARPSAAVCLPFFGVSKILDGFMRLTSDVAARLAAHNAGHLAVETELRLVGKMD